MEIGSQIILALSFYKLASLATGLACLYMGYKLFMSGIWGNAGSLETKFDINSLTIKHAAPGTFFAILGAIIVCTTLIKGLELESTLGDIFNVAQSKDDTVRKRSVSQKSENSSTHFLPPKPPF